MGSDSDGDASNGTASKLGNIGKEEEGKVFSGYY